MPFKSISIPAVFDQHGEAGSGVSIHPDPPAALARFLLPCRCESSGAVMPDYPTGTV